MNRIYVLFIIEFSLLSIFNCKSNYLDDFLDDYDLIYAKSLRKSLKKYLIKQKLFESNKLIKPDEMRKIFIDVMLEGVNFDEMDDFTKELYEELAKIFIDKYYKERKEIKEKEIYELFNVNDIMQKYYELNGEMPIFDDDYDESIFIDDDDDDDDNDLDDDDDYDDYADL